MVKTLGTLSRGLRTLEAIAVQQPIGLTALTRELEEDRSAVQRTLATLHEEGWIRPVPGTPPRWELSLKPLTVAGRALDAATLPTQVRPVLEALRDTTGETVHLALLESRTLVVAVVADARHVVRSALRVGQAHPVGTSAAGRAILAYLTPAERSAVATDRDVLPTDTEYEQVRAQGWSLSAGAVQQGSTSLAAAVLDLAGRPIGAIVVSGPDTRLTEERYPTVGGQLVGSVSALGPAPR